jgi:hypothetical protein
MVLALLLSTAGVQAQRYQIKLDRPLHAGDRFQAYHTASEKDELNRSIRGSTDKEGYSLKAEMTAVQEILAVDTKGDVTKARFTIDKMVETADGKTEEVIAPGRAVFEDVKDGKRLFYLENEGLTKAASRVLRILIGGEELKSTDADAALGTPVLQEIGGTWKIDGTKLKDYLSVPNGYIVDKNIQASGKLVALTNLHGIPCLHVLIQIQGSSSPNMGVDMEMRKSGVEFVKTHSTVTFDGFAPTNTALPQVEMTVRRTMEGLSKIRGGSDRDQITHSREFNKSSRWLPLPREPK